jgi:ABC-type nitrate/sulfonate/bicarbonate transport system substrate-binding protein
LAVTWALVDSGGGFQQQPEAAEHLLKGLVESLAFILAPANKAMVVGTIMKRLKITDPVVAEQGYRDLVQIIDQKPFVSLDGIKNIQRMMKIQNPVIGTVKVEDLIDNRPLRRLEESGFLQRTYVAYGINK